MTRAPRATTFTVAMPRPETHLYEITMQIAPFASPTSRFDLVLPVWTPGSYLVREFSRNVRDLAVEGPTGMPARALKVEKNRWRVGLVDDPSAGPFTVRYRVFAHELSVRTSHLDASHGYGNGANLFFYVEGRKDEPQRLRFELPAGWRVSIALPGSGGAFRAADYDELVDSPFECGTHRVFFFRALGVPHELAIWGEGNEDPARLVRDLAALVREGARLFGELPYDRYLFLVHLAPGAGGGLEHRASQSVGIEPFSFRPGSSYRGNLRLFAHELFHAWNVKRIRPGALGPFDYTKEVYTRDLWAMEGITSYYEELLPLRAGLMEPEHLFEELGKRLKAHRETPGARVQSAEDASFDAWIRHYRPDENSPNVAESYYRRGCLVAWALDLTIRRATRGRRSLDDLMGRLWRRYGSKGRPYPPAEIERIASEAAGRSLALFFERFVRGVETPPFERLLRPFGLVLREKPEKDADGKIPPRPRRAVDFGWKTKKEKGGLVVEEVYAGRAASDSGINAGDELVAISGVRADEDELKRIERDGNPGAHVDVTLFRRGRLRTIRVALGARRLFTYEIAPDGAAGREAVRLRRGWLGRR
ncbi:MAG: M61 family metallopeptidase [Acidithiobacillales bacterium]